MTTSIFINALGQAIFESCGQALLIYVVLQLLMQLFPSVSSKYRYDINYLGLIIITCWFLANLVKVYWHMAAKW
jgi:bla regulator protein BlaR1